VVSMPWLYGHNAGIWDLAESIQKCIPPIGPTNTGSLFAQSMVFESLTNPCLTCVNLKKREKPADPR
jgi:hypothetical protein